MFPPIFDIYIYKAIGVEMSDRNDGLEMVARCTPRWTRLRQEFVEAQSGRCAICDNDLAGSAKLDHCHVTGFVRGALCCSCNVKLGWYEGRRKAIETYLARSAEFAAYVTVPKSYPQAKYFGQ